MSNGATRVRHEATLYGDSIGELDSSEWDLCEEKGRLKVRLELVRTRVPDEAKVVVVIYSRLRVQIFDCGTVGHPQIPSCRIHGDDRIMLVEHLFARGRHSIKIVDPVHAHRCIAWGERSNGESLHDAGAGGRSGIAVRKAIGLGAAAWRLDCDAGLEHPTVLVNEESNESLYRELKRGSGSRGLQAFFFPAICETVLDTLIADHLCGLTPSNELSTGWKGKWCRWIKDDLVKPMPAKDEDEKDLEKLLEKARAWKQEMLTLCRTAGDRVSQADMVDKWINASSGDA